MSSSQKPAPGSITWTDLTVPNADEVRSFYQAVVGWKTTPVSMGQYDDYSMNEAESGAPVTGICHARGVNADIPPQWLVYITVKNLDESLLQCIKHGGLALGEVRALDGSGRFCVIQDPSGAVAALFEAT
ncbi:MAG: glyoxalase [Ignavibacteria bacterium]|nr:MAG: glyoxalase [Ignavibacteria bacterium]